MTGYNSFRIDAILPQLKAGNQKQAFQILTEYASRATKIDQKKLFFRLAAWERRSAPSGIGGGVAIPHMTLRELNAPYILFARASQMIEYDSVDGEPVDLICMILSPETDGPYHLQRLARISRMLRDHTLCQRLRGADSVDALEAVLYDSSNGVELAA